MVDGGDSMDDFIFLEIDIDKKYMNNLIADNKKLVINNILIDCTIDYIKDILVIKSTFDKNIFRNIDDICRELVNTYKEKINVYLLTKDLGDLYHYFYKEDLVSVISITEERLNSVRTDDDMECLLRFFPLTYKYLSETEVIYYINKYLFNARIYFDGEIKKEDYDDFSYYVKKVLLDACGNLRFVSDRLKDDYDVALNWVRIFPFSIGYVSERLRNDKEFVKKALIYVPYEVLNRIAELNICNMEDVVIKEKSFLEMMNDIVEVQ